MVQRSTVGVSSANQKLRQIPEPIPQIAVHPDSFPRIFGLPVHAYLVYKCRISTHIWSTFTHKWSTFRPHLTDSETDALSPIYLYENPIWIACSSGVRCGKWIGRRPARTSAPSRGKGAYGVQRLSLGMCGAEGRSRTPPSSISRRSAE